MEDSSPPLEEGRIQIKGEQEFWGQDLERQLLATSPQEGRLFSTHHQLLLNSGPALQMVGLALDGLDGNLLRHLQLEVTTDIL